MNKIVLIGRLTKDPELRFAANSGTSVTNFTLAVNRPKQKDKEQEADFIRCVSFKKTAELIAEHFTKGKQIAVSGSIRTGSYEAQDGTKRYTTDVYVESFDFLDSGSKNNNTNVNQNDNFGGVSYDDGMTPVDDGDIPF